MSNLSDYINELKTAEAFSKQSLVFDEEYTGNTIIQYKRKRVREHVLQLVKPSSSILELNCGTGEDALYFAQGGHKVHATDVSEGMLARLREKKSLFSFGENITTELCSFNQLEALQNKGPFDAIFSNFGGLNCTSELDNVLASLDALLKPGGVVTLVIIPPFCLWETLLFFKGQFKTASRRFFSSKGRKAHIEGVYFKCWYYKPGFVTNCLKENFALQKLEGLCTLVPPSYMEGFAEKHPKLYRYLIAKEESLKESWPWRSIGDYFIISLQKKK
ncbi:class I SAM-dependent methyltransferase [Flavisolibacter ginsenosidimutans]|uniref:Class I SAM-dependent methyltransferase n=1 Tax=Flavisolibacter ginsenosidimutans TaxID=661481 RepID=A0A5B8UJU1_9BACT|nr:class I SAM-dependent methyltransferase [Flavisolibacter ginsenosidimutans]QEC56662.1 class I SAM-dependent methyltransferase [Flavisolibacter ginsenosidimutans]